MAKKEYHWADQAATRIIKQKGDKKKYVCAAGITPSGTVHIGNFREIITVDLVAKALKEKEKNVRFIYSWDDFDVFRKVPKNMPKKDLLKKYLRAPISDTPDTFDNKHKSFAEHNEKQVEEILPAVDIQPEFLYQTKKYRRCEYAEEIKFALENTEKIKEVLDKYRKDPLSKEWLPVAIFCSKCNKDTTKKIEHKGGYNIYYECECGNKEEFNIRKKGIIKLKWRVDWPMRWNYEKVDFEPAGKDHFASGGSRDSGVEILKRVWNKKPPIGFMYEWIAIKGGGEFSSSKGVATTLQDVLEIYEPCIVRYLFAATRPNRNFEISFDLDVLKIYEDFDKTERIYFGEEKIENEKKRETEKRNYELSVVKMPKKMPLQPSFRHLTTLIQIFDYDKKRVMNEFKIKNEFDKDRLKKRIECAINWLEKYAPDAMKFEVQKTISKEIKDKLSEQQIKALKLLKEKLDEKEYDEKELFEEIYEITKKVEIKPKQFFKAAYLVLVKKERGPRLAPFLITLGDKAKNLFSKL